MANFPLAALKVLKAPIHNAVRAVGDKQPYREPNNGSEWEAAYGRYNNVYLFEQEYAELQAEYPDRLERLIEEMSHYLAANGKTYQNYTAALRRWADKDRKGAASGLPDYSYKEGESL